MSRYFSKNCLKVILIGFILLNFQEGFTQGDFSSVDLLLKSNQKALGENIVALVWKDGKFIYKKEVGEFNAKTSEPVASCSKWLTAALVMTFVDQGKLKLDEPVANYIPEFHKYMKRYLTIRHCLSQTTGIESDGSLISKIAERRNYYDLGEEVNAIAAKEISNNPGKEFFYGGYGLNIAARVCEIIGKKPFERLVQDRIIRPLKMKGTSFVNETGGPCNPSGGARSTANDYINFMSMILNKGVFEGKQILSENAIKEMHRIQISGMTIKYAPPAALGYSYGLGNWIVDADKEGNGMIVTCPGLFGTFPYINFTKKYAAILLVKNLQTVQRKEITHSFMKAVDEQIQ